eukprot:14519592-Alexandrium_andersonii.AAC.1
MAAAEAVVARGKLPLLVKEVGEMVGLLEAPRSSLRTHIALFNAQWHSTKGIKNDGICACPVRGDVAAAQAALLK